MSKSKMVMLPRSVVEQAVASIEMLNAGKWTQVTALAATLRAALDQPQVEQEPVASLADAIRAEPTELIRKWRVLELIKDHTRPQPKPLTDEAVLGVAKSIEIQFDSERLNEQIDDILAFARAIEHTHGIGCDL